MELGEGCRSPAHKVAGITLSSCPTLLLPKTSLPIVIYPALASSASVQPPIISAHPLNQQPIASSSSSGPRHASHMAPIFTGQWATKQHLLEEKRTSDAHRLMHTEKVKQTIFIYVFHQYMRLSDEYHTGWQWSHHGQVSGWLYMALFQDWCPCPRKSWPWLMSGFLHPRISPLPHSSQLPPSSASSQTHPSIDPVENLFCTTVTPYLSPAPSEMWSIRILQCKISKSSASSSL